MVTALATPTMTGMLDYDLEVADTEADIARLNQRMTAEPTDVSTATRLLYRCYHQQTLTGHIDDLPALRQDVEQAIDRLGPNGDLCLLLGQIDFTLHRFGVVPTDLRRSPGLSASRPGRALLADVALRQGAVTCARAELEDLREPPSWDVLSRLAGVLCEAGGDDETADTVYAAAQDELSAKQMRAYAWLELQRGKLDLGRRRTTEAARHYERADRAYTGYWLVDEHMADLMAHLGRLEEAAGLLRRVVARVPRPTARQALGDVLLRLGRRHQAHAAYTAALAAYRESVETGGVHYLHHLVDYYTRVEPDPAQASAWAHADAAAAGAPEPSAPVHTPSVTGDE